MKMNALNNPSDVDDILFDVLCEEDEKGTKVVQISKFWSVSGSSSVLSIIYI